MIICFFVCFYLICCSEKMAYFEQTRMYTTLGRLNKIVSIYIQSVVVWHYDVKIQDVLLSASYRINFMNQEYKIKTQREFYFLKLYFCLNYLTLPMNN